MSSDAQETNVFNLSTDDLIKGANDVINVTTQIATGGIAGYGDGKFDVKRGVTTRIADESLGEITGRNMARDLAWQAQIRAEREEQRRSEELALEADKRRREDIAASYGAARRSNAGKGQSSLTFQPLGEEKDFLGL